jgi:two-component system KDP operon response regulator KdpE
MGDAAVDCVLVVEDHPDSLHGLVKLLTRNGYRVCAAATYGEALEAARHGCRVLVADLGLPDGSGLDLMREAAPRGVIGIAISGRSAPEDVQAAIDAGFRAYLVKPLKFPALLETLAQLTRPGSAGAG